LQAHQHLQSDVVLGFDMLGTFNSRQWKGSFLNHIRYL